MESKRVYVGGLYHEVTEKDLRQLFTKFGDVENIEIKKRLENQVVNFVFAYVNVKTTGSQITQCFKRLNGTFWKGKRLKLELAKESFLAKLQREREQNGLGGRPARPALPPPPPKRRTMQDRILDDVLSAKQCQSAGGVVDFTAEAPAPITVENGQQEEQEEKEETTTPKRKKRKARELTPPPPEDPFPGEEEEPPPTRGSLRMFGGIGRAPTASGSPVTAAAPAGPPSPASPGRLPASGTDFLSRLEAFSSVWGDDENGAAVPTRRDPEDTGPASAPTPASVSTPSVSPERPKPATAAVGRRGQSAKTAAEDNDKRMASLRQKQEAFQSQRRALQLALSAKADAPRPNKRIVFDASDDDEEQPATRPAGRGSSLFGHDEEDEGEEEADDFRIRPQYEGEKGQKLQALQARFGADERFTLDERFAEEEQEGSEREDQEDDGVQEEHRQQMDILHSVLGTSSADTGNRAAAKSKRSSSETGPVRFDPSLESHAQYQLDTKRRPVAAAERPASDRPASGPGQPATPAPVDAATFYQVAPQLGNLFSRGGQAGDFSLLKMMGRATEDDGEGEEEEYKTSELKTKTKHVALEGAAANPFRYDSSSSEDEAEDGSALQTLGDAAGSDWTQTRKFFLQRDDARLAEGLEWVRAALSVEELQERSEQQRPELLELFRTQRHSRQRVQRRGRGRGRRIAGR